MSKKHKVRIRPLSAKEMITYLVDYRDLERLIRDVYQKNWSFARDQDHGNRGPGTYEFSTSKERFSTADRVELDDWIAGKETNYLTILLLKDLCHKNFVKPGSYIVMLREEEKTQIPSM